MAYGIGVITMVEGIEQVKIKCKLYRSFALSLNVIRKALSIEHLWVDQINCMDFFNRGSGTRSKLGDIAFICSGALEFHRMQPTPLLVLKTHEDIVASLTRRGMS